MRSACAKGEKGKKLVCEGGSVQGERRQGTGGMRDGAEWRNR